jgi:hypothetical protein
MNLTANPPFPLPPAADCYKLDGDIIKAIYQRIKREVKKYNKLQTFLRDKIRGSFFSALKTIINDTIKVAKAATTLLETSKVQVGISMLASYLEQSPDTAKRHIDRMLELGFLVPVEMTEQEQGQFKGVRRFNKLYQINLEFLANFFEPITPAPSPENGQATMIVVHSACEQTTKKENDNTKQGNNANIFRSSFRSQFLTISYKSLIFSLLQLRTFPRMSANCPLHLAVNCFNIYKTTIRAVDMWISVCEGERYENNRDLTAIKKPLLQSIDCGGQIERTRARAAQWAA